MHCGIRRLLLLVVLGGACPRAAQAQVDPVPRELVQLGYYAALEGHAPLAVYAFFYRNVPDFPRTNLTLRLAVAPVYLDSELGIRHVLDENTDLGIGLAGGGYADSYDEIRSGNFITGESFTGHGGEASVSLYHCFNPSRTIPLNGVLRGIAHYSTYARSDATADEFVLPDDRGTFSVRTGLRWGGKEPTLFPALAMELSAWYEGEFRSKAGEYGLAQPGGGLDRKLEPHSHLFWGQALLAYTAPKSAQNFYLGVTAGTSVHPDRFSAYRLGALLPLVSEFPLSLPGYYYQEISAREFVLAGANYILPLDARRRWNANVTASTAGVNYLSGLEQPGRWHSGVGGGILYQSSALKAMFGYAYGVDAIRSRGRGAHSVGVLMQFDLGHARQSVVNPEEPGRWRGLQKILGAAFQ
jgi:hypothetical protein